MIDNHNTVPSLTFPCATYRGDQTVSGFSTSKPIATGCLSTLEAQIKQIPGCLCPLMMEPPLTRIYPSRPVFVAQWCDYGGFAPRILVISSCEEHYQPAGGQRWR